MMTTILTLAMAWLLIAAAPDIPLSRGLRQIMVDVPARWCMRIGRGHILLVLLLIAIVALVDWVMAADGISLLSMASPELTSWIVMFDVATWLDVAVTAIVVAGSVRLGALRDMVVRPLRGQRPRQRRARRITPRRDAGNDDADDVRRWALAA